MALYALVPAFSCRHAFQAFTNSLWLFAGLVRTARRIVGMRGRHQVMGTTSVGDDGVKPGMSREVYGPYIDAPTWPWSLAGCLLAGMCLVLAFAAWLSS
jgi:hypothetical protein